MSNTLRVIHTVSPKEISVDDCVDRWRRKEGSIYYTNNSGVHVFANVDRGTANPGSKKFGFIQLSNTAYGPRFVSDSPYESVQMAIEFALQPQNRARPVLFSDRVPHLNADEND